MSHSLASHRVTMIRMTAFLVLLVPVALALFLFGMEKMESVVLRRRASAELPDSAEGTVEEETDADTTAEGTDSAGGER